MIFLQGIPRRKTKNDRRRLFVVVFFENKLKIN
jgi:hypothetical protein